MAILARRLPRNLAVGLRCRWPRLLRPEVDTPQAWRVDYQQAAGMADTRWWAQFGDPVLNGLIETALRENYDVRIAVARIEQFLGQLRTTRSVLPTARRRGRHRGPA